MSYSYPLRAKVLSEFVGMTLTIFLGESVLANELLSSTKGHGMGLLAVSIGFGLAFGVNIAWFGLISAHLNPAMLFFLALLGKIEWKEFVACSCADFAGAFVGAVLVFIFYLPHFGFNSLPLPSNVSEYATYLEGNVSMDTNAGRIASAFGAASQKPAGETVGQEIRGFFRPPKDEHFWQDPNDATEGDYSRQSLLDKMETRHRRRLAATRSATALDSQDPPDRNIKRRHSAQIAPLLHTHDNSIFETGGVESLRLLHRSYSDSSFRNDEIARREELLRAAELTRSTELQRPVQRVDFLHAQDAANVKTSEGRENNPSDRETGDKGAEKEASGNEGTDLEEPAAAVEAKSQLAYKASLEADARAKLSIFATRPAIFNRPFNFLQEAILTAMLVLGAELFSLRSEMQSEITGVPPSDGILFVSFYISFYITQLILGLGGVTGLAANPARDFGPRLAHAILPIEGKGTSEWNYGLVVPMMGPMAGAALGAAIFTGLEDLYNMVEINQEAATRADL